MSKVSRAMDGNEAAAYASYAFTEVAAIIRSHHLLQWLNWLTSGQQME